MKPSQYIGVLPQGLATILILMLCCPEVLSQEIVQGTWQGQQIEYVSGQIAVKKRPDASVQDVQSLLQQHGGYLVGNFNKLNWALVQFPSYTNIFAMMDTLQQSSLIENVSPNQIGYPDFDPDDTFYQQGKQWPLYNYGQTGGTSGADINIRKVWDITRGSPDILIAILDSGIPLIDGQLSHPDLSNTSRIKLGVDFIHSEFPEREYDPSVRDSLGHGTHVAGILAAETNNGLGIAGVAGGCKILVHQVFTWFRTGTPLAFQNAVIAAVDSGAKIINFSGRFNTYDAAIENAVHYADSLGVILVVSAGSYPDTNIPYPARLATKYNNVLSVGATNSRDEKSFDSIIGSELVIGAPGGESRDDPGYVGIFSTLPNYSNLSGKQDYGYMAGTSMAAPHVAGVVGLMLSVNPSLTPAEIRYRIERTADKVGNYNYAYDCSRIGHSKELGWGRINAYKAVAFDTSSPSYGPPFHLTATGVKIDNSNNPYRPKLSWNGIQCPGISSYKIYRSSWGTENFVHIATVSHPETTYIDMDVFWAPSGEGENPVKYYVTAVIDRNETQPSNIVGVNCSICAGPIEKVANNIDRPNSFNLFPNYPNPFNPVTIIRYSLPDESYVTLKVYNVLGQEVVVLVDGIQGAGNKSIEWNASGVPSGVYYLRMIATDFSGKINFHSIRKLMVMK